MDDECNNDTILSHNNISVYIDLYAILIIYNNIYLSIIIYNIMYNIKRTSLLLNIIYILYFGWNVKNLFEVNHHYIIQYVPTKTKQSQNKPLKVYILILYLTGN